MLLIIQHSDLCMVTSWSFFSYKYKSRAAVPGAQESSSQLCLHTWKMISAVALSFLVLATALGSPAHGSPVRGSLDHELKMMIDRLEPSIHQQGMHRPADCCNMYTPRKIRCVFMESYFETTSRCSQPAVIFITKGQQKVCANPGDEEVQKCLRSLIQLGEKSLGEQRY